MFQLKHLPKHSVQQIPFPERAPSPHIEGDYFNLTEDELIAKLDTIRKLTNEENDPESKKILPPLQPRTFYSSSSTTYSNKHHAHTNTNNTNNNTHEDENDECVASITSSLDDPESFLASICDLNSTIADVSTWRQYKEQQLSQRFSSLSSSRKNKDNRHYDYESPQTGGGGKTPLIGTEISISNTDIPPSLLQPPRTTHNTATENSSLSANIHKDYKKTPILPPFDDSTLTTSSLTGTSAHSSLNSPSSLTTRKSGRDPSTPSSKLYVVAEHDEVSSSHASHKSNNNNKKKKKHHCDDNGDNHHHHHDPRHCQLKAIKSKAASGFLWDLFLQDIGTEDEINSQNNDGNDDDDDDDNYYPHHDQFYDSALLLERLTLFEEQLDHVRDLGSATSSILDTTTNDEQRRLQQPLGQEEEQQLNSQNTETTSLPLHTTQTKTHGRGLDFNPIFKQGASNKAADLEDLKSFLNVSTFQNKTYENLLERILNERTRILFKRQMLSDSPDFYVECNSIHTGGGGGASCTSRSVDNSTIQTRTSTIKNTSSSSSSSMKRGYREEVTAAPTTTENSYECSNLQLSTREENMNDASEKQTRSQVETTSSTRPEKDYVTSTTSGSVVTRTSKSCGDRSILFEI